MENKKPDSGGSRARRGILGGSWPLFARCAHHHRRRSDPCHQTRLSVAISLAAGLTRTRTERFTPVVM
jgi:hypothetical protein